MRSALERCQTAEKEGQQQAANTSTSSGSGSMSGSRKASRVGVGAARATSPPGQRAGFAARLAEREADQRALVERASALLSQLDKQPARLQAFELGYVPSDALANTLFTVHRNYCSATYYLLRVPENI